MNAFAEAWKTNQEITTTENGGLTYDTSADSNVDFFFKVGAMRGADKERLFRTFASAFGENPGIALRILLWSRDVRGGAGERQIFRDLLQWLERNDVEAAKAVTDKVPELGRWDDLLVFETGVMKDYAYAMVAEALLQGNGLCAKWMPRKGAIANELRKFLGMTPKSYRKTLVHLTDVVEQQMCSGDWSKINYEHVPSLAQSRYSKAFLKHDEARYREFGAKAKKYAEHVMSRGLAVSAAAAPDLLDEEVEVVKVNAGAVYPYDVLKGLITPDYGWGNRNLDGGKDPDVARAQWLTLPNYVGDKNILPIVDVSGSMGSSCGGNLTCLDVSVSLGLYMATKNTGAFHNIFMTFSGAPELVTLKGNDIVTQIQQISRSEWGMNTDLAAAFSKILSFAKKNRIDPKEMPEYLVVMSDMEFDTAADGKTAMADYSDQFEAAGYRAPKIVWWNIQSRSDKNVPVRFDRSGTALVSGFSPSIAKNIMAGKDINPVNMMLNTIMDPRYDIGDGLTKAA